MIETAVPRPSRAPKALLVVCLAAILAGCSGSQGTVADIPPSAPGDSAPAKGVSRVPRGPDAAKALQNPAPTKK